MRFRSTARNAEVVVRARDVEVVPGTTIRRRARFLTAEFVNHVFDSRAAQRRYGWTDDERELVEQAILNHQDFNPPNPRLGFPRFYLDEDEGRPMPVLETDEIPQPVLRCIYTYVGPTGDSEQCPRKAVEGDYCEEHAAQMAAYAEEHGAPFLDIPVPAREVG